MSAGLTESNALLAGVSRYEAGQERSRLFGANAEVARRQAESEAEAGAYNASIIRMRGAARVGQIETAFGANNLQQKGTPSAVAASAAGLSELDALTTQNNALRRAWGFEVQGASDVVQERMSQEAGIEGGIGSILSGGAEGYTQYTKTGSWF